jgi:thiol-disulfide isomerase/thioredoxin
MAATRKQKKNKSRALTGQILSPVNITNTSQLKDLDDRIKIGPVTLVFVYADWCGHCQRFKPMMDELEGLPGRSVQTVRIRDDMFPKSTIANTPLEGYPSLLLIKNNSEPITFKTNNGTVTNVIPEHNDMSQMKAIVKNAGTPEGISILNSSTVLVPSQMNMATAPLQQSTMSPQDVSESPTLLSPQVVTPIQVTPPQLPPDEAFDSQLIASQKQLLDKISTPKQEGGARLTGGLYNVLTRVAYQYGPAVAFAYVANAYGNKKSVSKKKKSKRYTAKY